MFGKTSLTFSLRFFIHGTLFMVALWNTADHYIFMLLFALLLSFFFFLA